MVTSGNSIHLVSRATSNPYVFESKPMPWGGPGEPSFCCPCTATRCALQRIHYCAIAAAQRNVSTARPKTSVSEDVETAIQLIPLVTPLGDPAGLHAPRAAKWP